MTNLVCLKHPRYDGRSTPELSCKSCCKIFVGALKHQQETGKAGQIDTSAWLDKSKAKAAQAAPVI